MATSTITDTPEQTRLRPQLSLFTRFQAWRRERTRQKHDRFVREATLKRSAYRGANPYAYVHPRSV